MTERDRQRRRRETPSAAPARNGRPRRPSRTTGEAEANPREDRPVRRSGTSSSSVSAGAYAGEPPDDTDEHRPLPPGPGRLRTGRILRKLSTRRAALLALVVCALALSVAVPLRTYVSERAQLEDQLSQQASLKAQESTLEHEQQELSDPAEAEAQIRERLRYVRPGQTPYVVQLPPSTRPPAPAPGKPAATNQSWYENLWNSVEGQH